MQRIIEHYTEHANREWARLTCDAYHQLEFTVTLHYLRAYLPPHGAILDAGGGPGRYAIELCRAGYDVTLLDLVPELVERAKRELQREPDEVRKRMVECAVGDIRDLSRYADGRFDAVLCLGGPISHIADPAGRERAVRELVRVTKPGGVVCIAAIGYLAALRTLLIDFEFANDLVNDTLPRLLESGNAFCGGMEWHFFRADELRSLTESCGLTTLTMAGGEGLSAGLEQATNRLSADPLKWRRWVEVALATASEPAVVDMSEHVLCIGRAGGHRGR